MDAEFMKADAGESDVLMGKPEFGLVTMPV